MSRGRQRSPVKVDEEEEEEEEEALVTLIEYRCKEVDHLRKKTEYYQNQLNDAHKSLQLLHTKLARLKLRRGPPPSSPPQLPVKINPQQPSNSPSLSPQLPVKINLQQQQHQRPQLLIPAVKPITKPSSKNPSNSVVAPPEDRKLKPPKQQQQSQSQSQSKDLITSVRTSSLPHLIRLHSSTHIPSHHNRRLRCLVLSPTNDNHFFTSALDGVVNLWELRANGSAASHLSSTNCSSIKGRWPEDIAWHPDGETLVAAYTADAGDTQLSVLNFNAFREKRVTFLEAKPHVKGVINNIQFMPWTDLCFATGGSDHAVVLWSMNKDGNSWKPQAVHRNMHSSAVTGVAGLQQKKMILSVGADKRIIGFDMVSARADFKHQIESKCMSVLPNPFDFNLFMVQTGAPGKQLRLFDIRLRQTEIHSFGWKQETSESQSALINQAWSSDGYHITSGSADPMIHIFDIRCTGCTPSQSVQAHQKRVFKAAWHRSLPLLVSISSDLNIGLHKIS